MYSQKKNTRLTRPKTGMPNKRNHRKTTRVKSREDRAIDEIFYGDKIFSKSALKIYKGRIR